MNDQLCKRLTSADTWLKCFGTKGKPGGKRRKQTSPCIPGETGRARLKKTKPGCVMQSSTYVENIDQKSAEFCSLCQKSIQQDKGNSANKSFPFSWWGRNR